MAIEADMKTFAFYCTRCRAQGDQHRIVEVPAGPAINWGGCPAHWLECTNCRERRGPMVATTLVGDGW